MSEPVLERKTCPKCEQYSRRLGVGQKVEAFNPSTPETQQAALCEEASLVYISESKGSQGYKVRSYRGGGVQGRGREQPASKLSSAAPGQAGLRLLPPTDTRL